jgi:hypothetical protein
VRFVVIVKSDCPRKPIFLFLQIFFASRNARVEIRRHMTRNEKPAFNAPFKKNIKIYIHFYAANHGER